jgi:hypothetical protein
MTSIRFSEDQLKLYAAKCAQDVEKNFQESNYALTKYGLMAFNQAYNYGLDDVPVYSGVRDLTIEDVERYRRANYRLSTMVLVIVGDFDTGHATKLVEKYFGSLESKPLELPKPTPADHDVTATWDIPADLIFEVYPGPYENQDERLVLTMFGNFLNRQLKADEILFEDVKATFCSGTIHPVGETPFFVFAQIRPLHDAEAVFPELLASIEQASGMVDEKVFDTMKINLAEYFESSLLESQRTLSTVPHYKILEQEAVNIAMKHYLRDGASTEEMIEKIHSIAYEDARRYLDSRLAEDSRRRVLIKGPGRAAGGQG